MAIVGCHERGEPGRKRVDGSAEHRDIAFRVPPRERDAKLPGDSGGRAAGVERMGAEIEGEPGEARRTRTAARPLRALANGHAAAAAGNVGC